MLSHRTAGQRVDDDRRRRPRPPDGEKGEDLSWRRQTARPAYVCDRSDGARMQHPGVNPLARLPRIRAASKGRSGAYVVSSSLMPSLMACLPKRQSVVMVRVPPRGRHTQPHQEGPLASYDSSVPTRSNSHVLVSLAAVGPSRLGTLIARSKSAIHVCPMAKQRKL